MIKGIDVSYYQGNIDFKKVKNDGVSFVIIRDGYGKTTDSKFYQYVADAKTAGVEIKGIYHFSYALNNQEARNEAKLAVENAKKAALPNSTIIFFDLEYDSVEWAKKNGITLGKTLCTDFTKTFCEEVEKLGYKAGIYANLDYFNRMYDSTLIDKYPFWYANWGGNGQWRNCICRQYSETGKVNGISGNVDLNEWFGGSVNEVPTGEIQNEKKSTEELVEEVLVGKWGNGMERVNRLTSAGYDYSTVQNAVNERITNEVKDVKPVTFKVVDDVILGLYGNGEERREKLTAAGYVYEQVQEAVNKKLNTTKVTTAKRFDRSIAGAYKVTATALNCRYIPGIMTDSNIVKIFYKDSVVTCYGYYTPINGQKWYLVQQGNTIGFVCADYLKRY